MLNNVDLRCDMAALIATDFIVVALCRCVFTDDWIWDWLMRWWQFAAVILVHVKGKYCGRVFEDRDVGFILGEGSEVGVVEGVELGLRRFTRNERARLRVTSQLAYGHEGCPKYDIPADADLDYEVELQDFVKVYCHHDSNKLFVLHHLQ